MLNRLILLCILLCLALETQSAPVDFYSATAPVASQTAKERKRAAIEGLKQVFVRVSGSKDVLLSPTIKSEMLKASQYLDQYYYQLDTLEGGEKQEQLVMVFSSSQVRRILAEAKVAVWPANRPKVLLWLVEDKVEGGKQFVNNLDTPVTQGLQQASVVRGLPLTFPLMDLDDQLGLSEEQVWSLDEEAILSASERYKVDTILVGRYTQTSQGQWWGTWQFFHQGQNRVYDMRTELGNDLGRQGLDPLADYLAELYSVSKNAGSGSLLYLLVSQVDAFKSYKGLLNYMDRLAVVSSYNLVSVQNNTVLLGVQLAGNLTQLNNAMTLDQKIQPEIIKTASEHAWFLVPDGRLETPLKYRWIGN